MANDVIFYCQIPVKLLHSLSSGFTIPSSLRIPWETASLKFMTDIVRHLKIGILHPSNSLPVTFYALFSGDKYREIDDKYRETRQIGLNR
jgi:hypothetical protein